MRSRFVTFFALFCADAVSAREKESLVKEGVTVYELRNLLVAS